MSVSFDLPHCERGTLIIFIWGRVSWCQRVKKPRREKIPLNSKAWIVDTEPKLLLWRWAHSAVENLCWKEDLGGIRESVTAWGHESSDKGGVACQMDNQEDHSKKRWEQTQSHTNGEARGTPRDPSEFCRQGQDDGGGTGSGVNRRLWLGTFQFCMLDAPVYSRWSLFSVD